MGRYIGLKVDEKLVAMGGERLNPAGYVEISAVGTHPEYSQGTGKGDHSHTNQRNIDAKRDAARACVTRIVTPVWFFNQNPHLMFLTAPRKGTRDNRFWALSIATYAVDQTSIASPPRARSE